MVDPKLETLLRQDTEAWNEWRRANPSVHPDIGSADLSGVDLSGTNFSLVHLSDANLSRSDLGKANLRGADLSRADLSDANLSKANLSDANLHNADLHNADLRDVDLKAAILIKANLRAAILEGAILIGTDLSGTDLSGADLKGADLFEANLSEAILDEADLSWAILVGTDLSGATLDSATKFHGSVTQDCTIERFQLEQLANYGGLTVGNRMTMNIIDGVARLRASYSGFWQWIHLTALALFVFPYVWFVVAQLTKAKFILDQTDAYIPLWKALLTFIYNGGINWQGGPAFHWSFVAFLYLTFYNILRAILLWKTKQLELQQESSGLPAIFSLEGSYWGKFLKLATWLFFIYLAIALFNAGHFFTQQIPLD